MRRTIALVVLPLVATLFLGLADDPLKDLEAAAKANDKAKATDHVKALVAAGGHQKKAGVEALFKYGPALEDATFYDTCVQALAAAKGEGRAELLKQLKAGKTPQRVLGVDALAFAADEEAIDAIGKTLADDKAERAVHVACARGLAQANKKSGVDPLIKFLERMEKETKKGLQEVEEAKAALKRITGSSFDTAADWKAWWDTQKGSFDPEKKPAPTEGKTVSRSPAKLFGTEVRSNAVVVALDVSTSMRVIDLPEGEKEKDGSTWRDPGYSGGKEHADSRMARARKALVAFVEALPPHTRFDLVVFGDTASSWQEGNKLVAATPEVKKAAVEWIGKIDMQPATRTDLGLQKAFEHEGIDEIYLISDGIPEARGNVPIKTEDVLELAKTLNRTKKLTLHTLGFPGRHKPFLEKLAQDQGGVYKDVR